MALSLMLISLKILYPPTPPPPFFFQKKVRILKFIQWNPDITMYQGTGKITLFYRGIVINEFPVL